MRPILFLLPSFDAHFHARQASLLIPTLARERFSSRVYCLHGNGLLASPIIRAGIPLEIRAKHRVLPLEEWFSLKQILAEYRPALIHVWGIDGLKTLSWATSLNRSLLPPVVVSLRASILKKHRLSWWNRRLLKRVRAVVVPSDAERSALIAAGLPAEKTHVIRPGVPQPEAGLSSTDFKQKYGIPSDAPIVMGTGHMESSDRFHDAVWAYEFMKYVVQDLQLVLIGDGPNQIRLGHHFRSARQGGMGVHFLGARADAPSLLQVSDVVQVSHRRDGGTYAVLEAMAAGKPVVSTRLPHLAELIRDDETGLLTPPVDQPALARATLRLLEDRSLREQFGGRAREVVRREFRVDAMTQQFEAIYERLSV